MPVPPNLLRLYFASAEMSDVGRERKNNEDSVLRLPSHGVFCVADGMGGAAEGEFASKAVVDAIRTEFAQIRDPAEAALERTKVELVGAALNKASQLIKNRADSRGDSGCGSTAVVLVFGRSGARRAVAIHAGDSRLYRCRGRRLKQITRDHSFVAAIKAEEDASVPAMFRGMIMNAVGLKPSVEPEVTPCTVRHGDTFLLCSDGLTNMLSDPKILRILRDGKESGIDVTAARLVKEANEAGGKDNISVVLVRVSFKADETGASAQGAAGSSDVTSETISTETPISSVDPWDVQHLGAMGRIRDAIGGSHIYVFAVLWVRRYWKQLIVPAALVVAMFGFATAGIVGSCRGIGGQGARDRNKQAMGTGGVAAGLPDSRTPEQRQRDFEDAQRNIGQMMQDAQRTGRWGKLHSEVMRHRAQGDVFVQLLLARPKYENWHSEWIRVYEDDVDPAAAYRKRRKAVEKVLARAERKTFEMADVSWKGERAELADQHCRLLYNDQWRLLRMIEEVTDSQAALLKALRSVLAADPEQVWRFAAAGGPGGGEIIKAKAVAIEDHTKQLGKWLSAAARGPMSTDEILACPSHLLPSIRSDAMAVWGLLWHMIDKLPTGLAVYEREIEDSADFAKLAGRAGAVRDRIVEARTGNKWDLAEWVDKVDYDDLVSLLASLVRMQKMVSDRTEAGAVQAPGA